MKVVYVLSRLVGLDQSIFVTGVIASSSQVRFLRVNGGWFLRCHSVEKCAMQLRSLLTSGLYEARRKVRQDPNYEL